MITFGVQFVPILASDANDPAIYGRWLSEYEYPDSGGTVRLRGITEFFENDTYSYAGFLTHTAINGQSPVTLVFRINATGEWKGDDEKIVTTLNHMIAPLDTAQFGSTKFSGSEVAQKTGKLPKLSDAMPQGLSEQYEVISLEPNRMELSVSNLEGNPVTIEMVRTQSRTP